MLTIIAERCMDIQSAAYEYWTHWPWRWRQYAPPHHVNIPKDYQQRRGTSNLPVVACVRPSPAHTVGGLWDEGQLSTSTAVLGMQIVLFTQHLTAKMRVTKRTSCPTAFHHEYVIQRLRVQFALKSHDTFYVVSVIWVSCVSSFFLSSFSLCMYFIPCFCFFPFFPSQVKLGFFLIARFKWSIVSDAAASVV